ncbi:MAG: VanZ family protein [Candidatus Aminicenantes bacterium]|nr:VanZ family protein [Candidatus Aminicenantes bacterium]
MIGEKGKKFLAWFLVGLCSLAIFFVIPFARAIQKFTSAHFGASFFITLLLAFVAGAFLAVLYVLFFRLKIRRISQYIWLALFAGLYFYIGLAGITNPSEGAHYLEYGLLGCLLFRAWRFSIPDAAVYPAAFFSGALVGILDEIIQWIAPGRYWDLPDVGMNALAVGLVLLALGMGLRPKLASAGLATRSVRTVSILFAVDLVVLGLCLSNTPARTSALASGLPFLAPLERQEPMRESILKHEDPEIGTFYSRLTIAWLQKTDREQASPYGQILTDWKNRGYDEFLASHTTLDFPFLYEMRVHLFRRDKRFASGWSAARLKAKRSEFFIAWKENRILEKYFGETLRRSPYYWDEKRTAEVESLIDKNAPYDSPVSKNVFYWLKEGPMWAAILVILGLLAGWNIALARRRR